MKRFLWLIILVINCFYVNAQQWFSSGQIEGTGNVNLEQMVVDAFQNTYVTGFFPGSIKTKTENISAKGSFDIFLSKRNDAFNEIWTITIGGVGGMNYASRLALVDDGILVVGAFVGTCKFSSKDSLIAKGARDVFLAKYDFDGNFQWAKPIASGTFTDAAIMIDQEGYVMIAGRSTAAITFNGETAPATPAGGAYLAKYTSDGNTRLWYATVTGVSTTGGIASNPSGGYVWCGSLIDTQTITSADKTTQTISSSFTGRRYSYILSLGKDGNVIRTVKAEGTSNTAYVQITSITNNGSNLCLGGIYQSGDFKFNDTFVGLPNAVSQDAFLLQIIPDGANFKIVSQTISSTGNNSFYGLGVKNDILYATGLLAGPSTFNFDKLNAGLFVAAYDLTPDAFVPIGAVSDISSTGSSDAKGLAFSPKGVKIAGGFKGTITIGNDSYTAPPPPPPPSTVTYSSMYMANGALITCIDSINGKNVTGADAKAKNGELEIDVRGFLPGSPHTIAWSKMGTGALPQFNNMPHITGLDAGEYTAKLSYNDNRSSRSRTFRITAPDAFSIDHIEVTNPTCDDETPVGTITVTASVSGSHTVHYRILQTTNKDNQTIPEESAHIAENTTGIFANCPPGRYTVTVWLDEAVDLALEQNASVVEEVQNPYTIDITDEGYACNRLNAPGETGSITVAVDENQTLEWYALVDAASGATAVRGRFTAEAPHTHQFNNVAPGTYQVWTGMNACIEKSADISLIEPPAVIINFADAVSETCVGKNDGVINVDVSGGVNVIYYRLYEATEAGEKGNPVSDPQTNNYFENLSPGNYIVTAADGNAPDACTAETSVTVNPGYAVAVALTPGSLHHACAEKNNGQFAVTATGGPTANYSFYRYKADASAGSTPTNVSGIFINLEPYEYMVKAVDQVYGCEATLPAPVIVSRLAAVTFDQPVQTQPLCYGESNGKITVNNLSGGMGTYNLTLTKDGAPVATGKVTGSAYEFTGLHAGLYTVAVTDDYTCSGGSKDVEVTQPEVLTVTVGTEDITNVLCFGDRTGAIAAHAAGGTSTGAAPYQFELYQGATLLRGPQPENTFRDLPAGTGYEVKVTDANGCTAHTSSLGISEPPVIAVSVDERLKDINCKKEDGRITVSASGGWGGFEFSLRDANDDKLTDFSIEPVIPIKAAGSYRVKAKDSKGCLNNSDVIAVRDTSVKSFTYAVKSECNNKDDGTITVSTDETGMKYSLVSFKPEQPSPEFLGLNAGNYKLMLKNQYFCKDSANVTVAATSLEFTVTTANAPRASGTGTATITGVTGGESPYTYSFNNAAAAALSIPQTITGLQPNKLYSLTVADKEGCSTNHPVEVTIATGFEDMDAPSLKIYPNPSDGRFYIEWKTQGDMRVTVEIIGMSGQVVYKGTAQTGAGGVRTYIDMGNHAKGTYILHVPELNIRQRIVIQ